MRRSSRPSGWAPDVIESCFTGTSSRLGGVEFDVLAEEVLAHHRRSYPPDGVRANHRSLITGGEYQWRRDGEIHLFNPQTVFRLQHSTRAGRYDIFKEYTKAVDEQAHRLATLRGLFTFKKGLRPPVPIEEVEPVEAIVKRFGTGAISYGSISQEMHETLAIAMNRLGGRSNTGEGGEDSDRYTPDANGDSRRSAVKQVASGRFGVTSEYLVNADDIQIKISQGAKPGEGGQLPGSKVYPWIARTRGSTPGVGLISPPPHHDIYSIEDIKQLIHDLKNANPRARIHVKLVSELGVGTVAAGVAKAYSDVVLISGHDGGTGASPLSSIKHAGAPWELGLAETQQTLLVNGLRERIVVQTDGQLKTGRDVVIAALLGAEEFGFATAPLVVSGCIMMRVCHLDTCPVGVATQNPELRKRFDGRPEYVVNFMRFIAQEVREHLAELGFRSVEEAVGQSEVLDVDAAVHHWKTQGLNLRPIFHKPELPEGASRHCTTSQDHGLERALDNTLIQLSEGALRSGDKVRLDLPVRNVNRTVGTMLGYEVTKRWGFDGLPDDTIDVTLTGSAGQSFGAFLPRGVTLRLIGDATTSSARACPAGGITLRPDPEAPFVAEENVIAGNVILYGATSGELFVRGVVGERFCVRNSGALAVVEGVGDHGCEYMTGGTAVVLGPHRAQLRGRHVRRRGVPARRPGTPDQRGDGRHRPPRRGRPQGCCSTPSNATTPRPARRWPTGCSPTGTTPSTASSRSCRRTSSGCSRPAPRPSARAATPTWRSWRPLMGDPKGFLTTPRQAPTRRPVDLRLKDWHEVYEEFPDDRLELQAGRCMNCGIPFCHQGCPLGNLIPEWNDLVYRDEWREAIERLHATNNFPEFTGTLCPAPCEAACVLAINSDAVTIKQVELQTIDHAWDAAGSSRRSRPRRPARRWPSSGRARPGWPRPSSSPGWATTSRCSSGRTASAGCCATASPSSRWRSPGSTGAWPRWRPRAPCSRRA